MTDIKCKAQTKKLKSCENYAMNGSEYCYIHSFGRLRKIPFWKNSTIHLFISITFSIIIFFFNWFSSPTKNDTDEIKALIISMQQIDKTEYDRLIKKYPLGYALFAIDHKKIIIPYKSRVNREYEIEWGPSKVTKISSKEIVINLPIIYDRVHYVKIEHLATAVNRKIGRVRSVILMRGGVKIYNEMVFENKNGFICLLGFREETNR